MTSEWMSRRAWLGAGAAAVSASACRVDRAGDDVQQQSAQVLDVRQFGATGNGRDDDYPAIARALDAARKTGEFGEGTRGAVVFFPPGVYRVTRPLDCNGGQMNLRGAGPYQSVVRGDTGDGGAIIECIGGRFSSFRGLTLDTRAMRNRSTVGILVGRNPRGEQAGDMHFQELTVHIDPNPRANGGRGTVGLYNVAAEVQGGQSCTFGGDVGAVFTPGNYWRLAPRHTSMLAGEGSMTVVRFVGHNTFYGIHGPALRLEGGASFHFEAFLSSWAGTAMAPQVQRYGAAIEVLGSMADLTWRGYLEGFHRLMRIHRVPVVGLRLEGFASRTPPAPFIQLDAAGGIDGGSIDIAPTQDTQGVESPLIESEPGMQSMVRNTHLWLRNQTIRLQGGATLFQNNLVVAQTPLARAAASITAARMGGNVILASDGVEAGGTRLAGSGPTSARPSAASLGAGAQFYDTRLRRPLWSDGQAWRDAMGNAV
ncbi:MAG TPA: glycosyl hydrolase family 28-related protein [Longimicrobium sp.]|nr:glycosyl hydrolase family 28-related protein [Longimicrobium sp.]